MELHASYVYTGMGHFFAREDQAMHGFSKFFLKHSDEEREHANMFMEYQNLRGGSILLMDIKPAPKNSWNSVVEAVEDALVMEKEVNESLLKIHEKASEHKDVHLGDFIE